jgi:hypothetical protein
VAKSKRTNYLIDKPFQLGFIVKYLLVLIVTMFVFFGLVAFYYYQDSILGVNLLDQNITIKNRGHLSTPDGYKIYKYDKEQIDVYEKITNGTKTYYCLNPFNTSFTKDQEVPNVVTAQLEPSYGPIPKETKMFFLVINPLILMFLVIVVIISVYSLFFSHRMAGPVYRMRVSLDRMLAGDFDFKIRCRKNDFFINIIDKMEQLRVKVKNNEISAVAPKEKLLELKKLIDSKASYDVILKKLDDILI